MAVSLFGKSVVKNNNPIVLFKPFKINKSAAYLFDLIEIKVFTLLIAGYKEPNAYNKTEKLKISS